MKRLAGVLLVGGLLAGCSTTASPPPTTVNLRADQQAVDVAQAAVTQDEVALNNAVQASFVGVSGMDTFGARKALAAVKLRLQVAQDQLQKDENG